MSASELAQWKQGVLTAERYSRECIAHVATLDQRVAELEQECRALRVALIEAVELIANPDLH